MSFFDSTDFMAAVCMFFAGAGFFGAVYLIVCGIRNFFRNPKRSSRPQYVHELSGWDHQFLDRRKQHEENAAESIDWLFKSR